MAKFEVLYAERHGGTFNGCLETLHLSLENFIKDKIREFVGPALDPDHRVPLGACFAFLCGQSKNFPIIRAPFTRIFSVYVILFYDFPYVGPRS